jgi:hypothetical protein
MTVEQVAFGNALVFRDDIHTHRWYDAIGEGVIKHLEEFLGPPSDDTTGDPTEWEVTVVEIGAGTSTFVVTDLAGGAGLVTNAGNENDGWSMQLGAAAGENIILDGRFPLYVGCEFAINDVDQSDVLIGVAVTDTALLGGVTDGMYFRSVDESATINFVTEKDSVESSTSVGTLTDGTYSKVEFLFDGGTVRAYFNDTEQTSTASTAATFPNDELMRLSFEFLNGEAAAQTCTIKWLRMIHIRS